MSISNIAIAIVIFRGGFPNTKDSAQVNAISYLKALGILKGDGDTGNFRPNHYLTRQEFAVIIARIGDPILGINITVNQSPGLPPPPPPPPPPVTSPISPYVDSAFIADWAQDAVTKVTEYGWVKGYEDGSFGPTNNLTYAEAITVLLRVLGHEDTIDQSQWPATYIAKAMELEMNLGVTHHPILL